MIDKELIAATSTQFILLILREGDSYGYEIIQRVHALTNDAFTWTESMLYPVLHRLEEKGYVRSYWEASPTGRKRKYYSLTKEGQAELEDKWRQWHIANTALLSLRGRRKHTA